jgi:hypothetical protein
MLNTVALQDKAPGPTRLDAHVHAWRPARLEEFWMQAILDDRADTALPPKDWWTGGDDGACDQP